jgi:hypothetical protein
VLRLAALLHAVGMPWPRARDLRGGWRYTGHEPMGARMAATVMRRLRASNADIERVTTSSQTVRPVPAGRAGLRRATLAAARAAALVNDLFRLRFALWRARPTERGDAT